MWFKSEVVLSIVKTILLRPFTCFSLKSKIIVFTDYHCKYISAGYLERFRTLVLTDEVFELSYKKILLVTGCGHRNYVDFSMLITWMSGRGSPAERNH